ncbi:hypothetical protein T10_7668 [Trichinella papuae]|uniref:Uncharacterized protein n=1 Tax=Trichinella papuae TaxID=268474 RepID=A0A0V1MGG9_9BILA|nr:hypothetical protein T10_7668 [Trichinella papuae]
MLKQTTEGRPAGRPDDRWPLSTSMFVVQECVRACVLTYMRTDGRTDGRPASHCYMLALAPNRHWTVNDATAHYYSLQRGYCTADFQMPARAAVGGRRRTMTNDQQCSAAVAALPCRNNCTTVTRRGQIVKVEEQKKKYNRTVDEKIEQEKSAELGNNKMQDNNNNDDDDDPSTYRVVVPQRSPDGATGHSTRQLSVGLSEGKSGCLPVHDRLQSVQDKKDVQSVALIKRPSSNQNNI